MIAVESKEEGFCNMYHTHRSIPAALDAVRELCAGIYDDVIGFSNLLKEENVEMYRVKRNRKKEDEGNGEKGRNSEDPEDEHQLNRQERILNVLLCEHRFRFNCVLAVGCVLKGKGAQSQNFSAYVGSCVGPVGTLAPESRQAREENLQKGGKI